GVAKRILTVQDLNVPEDDGDGPHGLYALVPAAVVAIDEGTGGTVRGVFSSLPPLPRHVGEASWTPPVLDARFLSSLVSPTRAGGRPAPQRSPRAEAGAQPGKRAYHRVFGHARPGIR